MDKNDKPKWSFGPDTELAYVPDEKLNTEEAIKRLREFLKTLPGFDGEK